MAFRVKTDGGYKFQGVRSKSFSVGYQLVGEWARYDRFMHLHRPAFMAAIKKGRVNAAKSFRRAWKKAIFSGGSGGNYAELSSLYRTKKANVSPYGQFMFTGTYYKNIVIKNGKGDTVSVGIRSGARRPSVKGFASGPTTEEYVNMLEKGWEVKGHRVPARPLIRNTYRDWGGRNRISKYMFINVRKAYAKL